MQIRNKITANKHFINKVVSNLKHILLLIAMTVTMFMFTTYIPDSRLKFLHNRLRFGKLETCNKKTT